MRPSRSPHPLRDPGFWRGVARGMRSPAGRRGFDAGYNRAVWPGALGAFLLLRWVMHDRVATGRPPLSTGSEIGVSMLGALLGVAAVAFAARLWRRWRAPST